MRTLEEIDRDLEIAYADMRNFIHSGFSISPVLEDDIDELRDERAAVVKAMQDAGLMRYEVCILPKPENTSSYCAAFYKITATSQNQAFEHGKETFIVVLRTAASPPKILTLNMTSASREGKRSNESTRFQRLQTLSVLWRTCHGAPYEERPRLHCLHQQAEVRRNRQL